MWGSRLVGGNQIVKNKDLTPNHELRRGCPSESTQGLGARVDCILHAVASFGANIGISVQMEVLMNLNVAMTSLVAGVALLRRSGDGSEIRRGKAWKLSSRNPRARATEGSISSLRKFL